MEIISDILRAASGEGATMTALVYRSNSNFLRTRRYVDLLTTRNLLECLPCIPKLYRTTEKGEETIRTLAEAEEYIFGTDASVLVQPGFLEGTRHVPAFISTMEKEARVGFAKLSEVCRHREGDRCKLCIDECRIESCLLVTTGRVQ